MSLDVLMSMTRTKLNERLAASWAAVKAESRMKRNGLLSQKSLERVCDRTNIAFKKSVKKDTVAQAILDLENTMEQVGRSVSDPIHQPLTSLQRDYVHYLEDCILKGIAKERAAMRSNFEAEKNPMLGWWARISLQNIDAFCGRDLVQLIEFATRFNVEFDSLDVFQQRVAAVN